MDKNKATERWIPRIVNDDITLRLWKSYVSLEEQNDVSTLKALLAEIINNPYPVNTTNPILKRMIADGTGFDGYNAAMMTLGYLQNICLYYINQTTK